MAYWHMQMFKDRDTDEEKRLLNELDLIGIGEISTNIQIKQFKKEMNVGDIVLVHRGKEPIALVEIQNDYEDIFEDDFTRLDWFRYRRKVKVLDWATDKLGTFPQARGFLQKLIDTKTKSYQYIEKWHKKISPSFYKSQKGLKLQKIYIQKYNMFEEFNLNFNEEITVIAGINGSGKTTLLEYIKNFTDYISDKDDDKSLIEIEMYNEKMKESKIETLRYSNAKSLEADFFNKHIFYFPTGTDIADLKVFLAEYVKHTMYKEDLKPSKVFDRIREKIDKVFEDLEILVKFDNVDADGNVYFRNKKDEIFSIDNISTGEKTLLSKVLYLYLKEIKDSVVLIDEPELSLHPAWQNKVLKLYEKFAVENNCQIIIATHSPHILGSAKSEYIRLLTEDGVVDNFSNTYGAKFSQILTDIMGVRDLRTPEINEKFTVIEDMIAQNRFDTKEFKEKWQELEEILGKNYFDLKLLKLEIASRRKDVQNNKK